ncbi:hypothetical protein F5B20DRAFT_554206 [Whalleya microplaca]|nr:hypothetical protein F5B20DRAFT_554206 [Whalleya microplaca]
MKYAWLAQSVERETLNLKVAGSTPALGSIPNASQFTGICNHNILFFFIAFSSYLFNPFNCL